MPCDRRVEAMDGLDRIKFIYESGILLQSPSRFPHGRHPIHAHLRYGGTDLSVHRPGPVMWAVRQLQRYGFAGIIVALECIQQGQTPGCNVPVEHAINRIS